MNSSATDNLTSSGTQDTSNHQCIIINIFFAILTIGCILNLIQIITLLKCRRNGMLSVILQIAIADVLSLYVAITEILTLKNASWYSSPELCPFFKGFEIFINTLIIYLIICFNFQTISLWNLHEISARKNKNRNPLTSCNISNNDSDECLVARQENRSLTIDYRRKKSEISVIFPTIFVWFMCISLSIPNFTLSSTVKMNNQTLCGVIDVYYNQILQNLLLIFKIAIPIFLLIFSCAILALKVFQITQKESEELLDKNVAEFRRFLIYGISLTIVYFITRLPCQFINILSLMKSSFTNDIKISPIYNELNNTAALYLSMLYYLGAPLRGILSMRLLITLKLFIKRKSFICCNNCSRNNNKDNRN